MLGSLLSGAHYNKRIAEPPAAIAWMALLARDRFTPVKRFQQQLLNCAASGKCQENVASPANFRHMMAAKKRIPT
jgi:hypothetical protein